MKTRPDPLIESCSASTSGSAEELPENGVAINCTAGVVAAAGWDEGVVRKIDAVGTSVDWAAADVAGLAVREMFDLRLSEAAADASPLGVEVASVSIWWTSGSKGAGSAGAFIALGRVDNSGWVNAAATIVGSGIATLGVVVTSAGATFTSWTDRFAGTARGSVERSGNACASEVARAGENVKSEDVTLAEAAGRDDSTEAKGEAVTAAGRENSFSANSTLIGKTVGGGAVVVRSSPAEWSGRF